MKSFQFIIEGNWGHFKKPETNNNPLTHDFITKTALIGLIGAVLGKERFEMRPLFPQLSEDLLYGVQILNSVKKESLAFTMRKAVNLFEKAPKQMEFLKDPQFIVLIALSNERSNSIFDKFVSFVKSGKSYFTPVLGLHNCPAILEFVSEGDISVKKSGKFVTKGFVAKNQMESFNVLEIKEFRVGFDKIPTYQNDDFWNLPDKYEEVIYPSEGKEISVTGDYYESYDGEKWCLI